MLTILKAFQHRYVGLRFSSILSDISTSRHLPRKLMIKIAFRGWCLTPGVNIDTDQI